MGIDVEFGVRTAERLADDEFEKAKADFQAAFPDDRLPHRWPTFKRDAENPNAIEISSLDRYYGTGYSRGFWPQIRKMGDWLMVYFGEAAEVRYGDDTAYGWGEMVSYPQQRPDLEDHWITHGHAPYRKACGCDHCLSLNGGTRHGV